MFILLAPFEKRDRPGYFSRCFQLFEFSCCHVYQTYVNTYLCSKHTHSLRLTHSLYLLTARNLLHQKVLWHIEVIFLEISCFARNFFFLYFQTPESYIFLNYKRAESVLKLFKQHGLQNYVLCFIVVNITMVECYASY